jgi:hypothetical protein
VHALGDVHNGVQGSGVGLVIALGGGRIRADPTGNTTHLTVPMHPDDRTYY